MEQKKTVTAILNVYKRVDYLDKQIDALLNQSYKIDKFIFCVNNISEKEKYSKIIKSKIDNPLIVEFSENQGVWNRFFLGFNVKTTHIFICDDDIIPGKYWIENCVKQDYGIIGSWGSIFNSKKDRGDREIVCETELANCVRPKELTEVDMSGHSWFFRKELLGLMFHKLPRVDYPTCGEELWVSFMCKKFGVPTYIIPMTEDIETWGNKEPRLGLDESANFRTEHTKYQEFFTHCINEGFIPLKLKDEENTNSNT